MTVSYRVLLAGAAVGAFCRVAADGRRALGGGTMSGANNILTDNTSEGAMLKIENDGTGDYGSLSYPNHTEAELDAIFQNFLSQAKILF